MRLVSFLFALLISHLLNAQTFGADMVELLTGLENRYNCKCITCLPHLEEHLQKTQDPAIIAQGYKEIAALLWYCNSNYYNNNLSAEEALRHSLMFHDTKEVRAMLDSINQPNYGSVYMDAWSKLDSPWQGVIKAKAAGGESYIIEDENTSAKKLCLRTDTGWISSAHPSEGWAGIDSLAYLRDESGRAQALLVKYGITSYGSGGGTTWHEAYVMDLQSLQILYRQGTYYSEEVFCGKYGPDPDCVPSPCTVEQPLYINNDYLVVGEMQIKAAAQGHECPIKEVTLSFHGLYGETPPEIQMLNIPTEYTFPRPTPGVYKLDDGYLVKAQ